MVESVSRRRATTRSGPCTPTYQATFVPIRPPGITSGVNSCFIRSRQHYPQGTATVCGADAIVNELAQLCGRLLAAIARVGDRTRLPRFQSRTRKSSGQLVAAGSRHNLSAARIDLRLAWIACA